VLHALVLAAETLPISYRAEDARAEQAVALRLEGAIVDGLRFGDFAVRPAPDFFRRSEGLERNKVILGFLRKYAPRGRLSKTTFCTRLLESSTTGLGSTIFELRAVET